MSFIESGRKSPEIALVPKSKECFVPDDKIAEMAQILGVTDNELVDAINEFLPEKKESRKEDGVSYAFLSFSQLSAEAIRSSTGVKLAQDKSGLEIILSVKEKPFGRHNQSFFVFVSEVKDWKTKEHAQKILISEKGEIDELEERTVPDYTPPPLLKALRRAGLIDEK